jgi:hypothetical protein
MIRTSGHADPLIETTNQSNLAGTDNRSLTPRRVFNFLTDWPSGSTTADRSRTYAKSRIPIGPLRSGAPPHTPIRLPTTGKTAPWWGAGRYPTGLSDVPSMTDFGVPLNAGDPVSCAYRDDTTGNA